MAKTTNIGGVTRDMTAEEITELESWQTEAQVGIDALEAKDTQTAIDKTSGNKKLKDLGLTDDEISALIG